MFIKEVTPRIIRNSRKEKTIEITIKTFEGKFTSSAPSGKSTGKNEIPSYNIRGIDWSLKMLKAFSKKLLNQNFKIKKIDDLKSLDSLIKKFETKFGKLGANITITLHSVFLKAAAKENNLEVWEFIHKDLYQNKKPKIPMPIGNCIGGGLHSSSIKGKKPDFQEFLLVPNEKTFSKAVTKNLHAYYSAKNLLKSKKTNDENAISTNKTNEETLEILRKVAKNYSLRIGLDIAASTFYQKGYYNYRNKELIRDKVDQSDYIQNLIKKYNLFYIEDPMQEEDFSGFKEILNFVKEKNFSSLIVGDDLTTTNIKYLRRAIESGSINAIIIKPNQIGSIIEVKKVVELCDKNNIKKIFSHRSGETMDNILGDYAVGFGADFIKCGIYGKERLIKLKRVIDIEKSLNK